MDNLKFIEKLKNSGLNEGQAFPLREELAIFIRAVTEENDEESFRLLLSEARKVTDTYYGKDIYLRGLIEFTNYCRNDCYYCGIRRSNKNADRYRLTEDEIMSCCDTGYILGYRTFVLQGGVDLYYTPEKIGEIVRKIKKM